MVTGLVSEHPLIQILLVHDTLFLQLLAPREICMYKQCSTEIKREGTNNQRDV